MRKGPTPFVVLRKNITEKYCGMQIPKIPISLASNKKESTTEEGVVPVFASGLLEIELFLQRADYQEED